MRARVELSENQSASLEGRGWGVDFPQAESGAGLNIVVWGRMVGRGCAPCGTGGVELKTPWSPAFPAFLPQHNPATSSMICALSVSSSRRGGARGGCLRPQAQWSPLETCALFPGEWVLQAIRRG